MRWKMKGLDVELFHCLPMKHAKSLGADKNGLNNDYDQFFCVEEFSDFFKKIFFYK